MQVRVWTYAEVLEEVLGLAIDVELAALRVLGEVEGGDLGDELILALTLLFLELEGDSTDWTTLNALHQIGGVTGNLFNQRLAHNSSSLFRFPALSNDKDEAVCGF